MIRLSAPTLLGERQDQSQSWRCASSTSPVIQCAMPSWACHSATAKGSLSAIASRERFAAVDHERVVAAGDQARQKQCEPGSGPEPVVVAAGNDACP